MKRVKIVWLVILLLFIFSACERKLTPPPPDLSKRMEVGLENKEEEEKIKKNEIDLSSWVTIEDNEKGYRIKVDRHWSVIPGKDESVERIFLKGGGGDLAVRERMIFEKTIFYQLEIDKIDDDGSKNDDKVEFKNFEINENEARYMKDWADTRFTLRTILNGDNRDTKLQYIKMAFQSLELFEPNSLQTEIKLPEDWILFRDDKYQFRVGYPREWLVDRGVVDRTFFVGAYPHTPYLPSGEFSLDDHFFDIRVENFLKAQDMQPYKLENLEIDSDMATWLSRNEKYKFRISTLFNNSNKEQSLQFLRKAIGTFQKLQ